MAIHKAAALAALLGLLSAPAAYSQLSQGATDGGTYLSRKASPRRRTFQASGTAIAAGVIAATVAAEYRGRR
jgi:hypothetical protein